MAGGDASGILVMNHTDSSRVKDYLSAYGAAPHACLGQRAERKAVRACTRKAEASGWSGLRSASIAATRAESDWPRCCAISASADQKLSSNATDVRWPASEKLRLINPLMPKAAIRLSPAHQGAALLG